MARIDSSDSKPRMVKIECNDSPEIISINANLLRKASNYLKKVVDGNMGAGEPLELDVPCEAFRTFAHWLFCGEVTYDTKEEEEGVYFTYDADVLSDAYVTGARLGAHSDYLNEVMDKLVKDVTELTTYEDVPTALEMCTLLRTKFEVGSAGWQFLIDWLVHLKLDQFVPGNELHDPEMFNEFIVSDENILRCYVAAHVDDRASGMGDESPWKAEGAYHVHWKNGRLCSNSQVGIATDTTLAKLQPREVVGASYTHA